MLNANSMNGGPDARFQKLDLISLGLSDEEFGEAVKYFKYLKKIRDEQVVFH